MAGRAWYCLSMAVAAGALLLASCTSASKASPPESMHSPTPAAQFRSTVSPAAVTPTQKTPVRWGFNPREYTNIPDQLPRYRALPPGYNIETVAIGFQQPTGIAFTPDGRMLVLEQPGAIRLVEDGEVRSVPYYVADAFMADTDQIVELGLVGITVDPDFASNGYIYIYYSTAHPHRRTVLARIRDRGDEATFDKEVLSLNAAPSCCHIAGSMRFAPDGTLFVAVGDHQRETDAQDLSSPFGKILHINKDGSPAAGNPFADDDDADPRVYAYGLRNPFDFAIHPTQRRIFSSENGYLGQDAVLEIKPGANYGWPGYDLSVPLDDVEQPLLFYNEPIGPSGMELYLSDRLPALAGALLFCQFHRGGALHSVTFDLLGRVAEDTIIATGCTSDVLTGPDGFIYFLDYVSGTVYRISAG